MILRPYIWETYQAIESESISSEQTIQMTSQTQRQELVLFC